MFGHRRIDVLGDFCIATSSSGSDPDVDLLSSIC